jgi:hypothetical protein
MTTIRGSGRARLATLGSCIRKRSSAPSDSSLSPRPADYIQSEFLSSARQMASPGPLRENPLTLTQEAAGLIPVAPANFCSNYM